MREEEKNQSSQWKQFFKKRWVFPAIYLVSAAVLISGIFLFQAITKDVAEAPKLTDESDNLLGKGPEDEPAIEVNQSFENIAMPVANEDEIEVVTEFFDSTASQEKQEEALIVMGNSYRPNMGIDIATKDGSAFEVRAALSGKVTAVRNDSLLGNVIEIDHDKGVATIYQSVTDILVQEGDTVKQGDPLGTSGTSELNAEAKNHLHFELRKDGTALNPHSYFGQPLTSLHEEQKEETVSEPTEQTGEVSESEEMEEVSETETDQSSEVIENNEEETNTNNEEESNTNSGMELE